SVVAVRGGRCYRLLNGPVGMPRRGRSWAGRRKADRRDGGRGRSGVGVTRRVAAAARAVGRADAKGAGRRDLWRAGDASIPGGGAEAEATTTPPGAADEAGEAEGAGRPPQDPLVLARSRRPSQVE